MEANSKSCAPSVPDLKPRGIYSFSTESFTDRQKHQQFLAANHELQDFLQRADGVANGTGTVTEEELKTIWVRLLNLAPEISDPNKNDTTFDANMGNEAVGYLKNLRTLRETLEKVCRVMLARRLQLEAAKRHIDGLRSWINAYQQTT